jgi:hypothetical protein
MWILHFLPDSFLIYVVNVTLLVGLASFVVCFFFINPLLRWAPQLASIHGLLQLVSIVLLVAGVYFKGSYATEMEWRQRAEELQKKIDEASQLSTAANSAVQTRTVTKIKIIKEKTQANKNSIQQNAEQINKDCRLSDQAVESYNQMIQNKIDSQVNIHE